MKSDHPARLELAALLESGRVVSRLHPNVVREVLTDKQCVKLLSAFTEKKRTLVKAVVERGVLKCEADAYKQIMTGKVLVNGHVCADPQREVSDEDEVWVSETANRGKGSR